MKVEEFVAVVMEKITVADPQDGPLLRDNACPDLYRRGFSVEDAVAFLKCTEEVNPELPEDVALARMKKIDEKYPVK